jgi:hypothetical protein
MTPVKAGSLAILHSGLLVAWLIVGAIALWLLIGAASYPARFYQWVTIGAVVGTIVVWIGMFRTSTRYFWFVTLPVHFALMFWLAAEYVGLSINQFYFG